jgi:hypothetical protein
MDTSQVVQFEVFGRSALGDSLAVSVAWTASGGTITPSGHYTGASITGTFRIIATHEATGAADTARVIVTDVGPPVASVRVTPALVKLSVGEGAQLDAVIQDDEGNTLPGRPLTWITSDADVATVSARGYVTGVAIGPATITALSEGVRGEADVAVVPPAGPVVFVGAGNIADCGTTTDEATAQLLDEIEGTVFTAGDNAYPDGSASDYADCYEPTWGRHKDRTRPTPGNHDYHTTGAAGYFDYFGANAGEPGKGYYSFELGEWQVIALNSNIEMRAGSEQEQWLRAELAASGKICTIAYWHHPRFSSGHLGNFPESGPLWDALYEGGAEVIVAAHTHIYERFAPQTPAGDHDADDGIRQFVVGTGGTTLHPLGAPKPNSEVRNNDTHGVLKLTLGDGTYAWEFIPIEGRTFSDQGSGVCH